MRSRTDSASARTSSPSTQADPSLRGSKPVSILMTVVLPLPLGPRKPKISPFSTRKLTPSTATKSPKRRTRFLAKMQTSAGRCSLLTGINLICRLQLHVSGHAAAHSAGEVIDANFYANYFVYPFAASLHVARKEFSLLINLFHNPIENGVGKRVDAN